MPEPAHSRHSRGLLRHILVPALLLIVLGAAANIWLVFNAASALDREAEKAQHQMVSSVAKRLLERLQKVAGDYAWWDDLYLAARDGIQPDWAAENLGPYLHSAFALSAVYVIGEDGAGLYGWDESGAPMADPARVPGLSALIARTRAAPLDNGSTPLSSFVVLNGAVHLAAASVIVPTSGGLSAGAHRNVLLVISNVSDSVYKQLEEDYHLTGLEFTTAPSDQEVAIALEDQQGQRLGYLAWRPARGSTAFLNGYWVPAACLLAAMILCLALLSRRWRAILHRHHEVALAAAASEDANRAKSAFIANMSHELRTPLNAVIGFSEILANETFGPHASPRYRDYASDILAGGHHLLAVINDILSLAKIEAGQQRIDLEPCVLEEFAQDVTRLLAGQAAAAGVALVVEPSAALAVRADATALRQILINLVANALKFTDAGGRVALAWRAQGAMVGITVADTGIGIPPDQLAGLGKPFVKVEQTSPRNVGGLGLGLSIVQGLVSEMHGTLAIESTPGTGTTVHIRLPRVRMAGARAGHGPQVAQRA
jgi:signal transduction histidine kinase